MARSAGLMVNYVYRLNEVERNHERYFRSHAIAASPQVEKLARECCSPRRRREDRRLERAGRLPENVMHFARLLRAAGLRVGSTASSTACARSRSRARTSSRCGATTGTGPCRRCCSRAEQRPIFDQAFRIFWRDPKLAERMMSLLLPHAHGRAPSPSSSRASA